MSQVSSFSGSQDSSHSLLVVVLIGAPPQALVVADVASVDAGCGVSMWRARSGDSWWSMCTTVQCIHTAQTTVSRNSTKKVLDGKPDHALV